MKLSVITIVRNDIEGLKKTVQSVISQESQDFEYIIIDGASTDGCKEYIMSLDDKIKKVSEPDSGIYNAMNKGVMMATGDYCIFMNAGDIFYDNTVIRKANETLTDADIYIGHTIKVGKHQHKRYAVKDMTLRHLLVNNIYHQSTFTKTGLLKEHPYREDSHIVSDWSFFLERWLSGATYRRLDFFVSYQFTGGVSTTNGQKNEEERQKVFVELFPNERIQQALLPQNKVEKKIMKAMTLSDIKRDLALIKYGFKFLLKDLF